MDYINSTRPAGHLEQPQLLPLFTVASPVRLTHQRAQPPAGFQAGRLLPELSAIPQGLTDQPKPLLVRAWSAKGIALERASRQPGVRRYLPLVAVVS